MALTLPPLAPDPRDRATFPAKADAHLAWQATNVTEMNAFQANLNALAAGGAYAIPYTWGSFSQVGGAAGGFMGIDQSSFSQSSTDYLYLDITSAGSILVTAALDEFDDSSSAIRGKIKVVKVSDPTKWLLFDVIGPNVTATYRRAIRVVGTAYSTTNPFVAGESVLLFFQRTGDKGEVGLPYNLLHVRDERASGTAAPAATTGTTTRVINTVKSNNITGASLAANQITLPAGTYDFLVFTGYAAISGHTALTNVTDANSPVLGMSHSPGAGLSGTSTMQGRVTITATKVFELRHVVMGTSTGAAFGYAISSGNPEIFADIFITKGG